MSRKMVRRGFTLRELLVVVTAICLLLAALVPAIQVSREESRRSICTNNLRQLGLSLQYYADTHGVFPAGALHAGLNPGGDPPVTARLGPSWLYCMQHFHVQGPDLIEDSQHPSEGGQYEYCADDVNRYAETHPLINYRGTQIPRWKLSTWHSLSQRCPSSPLPEWETSTGPIGLPSYVAIAGGCDIDPQSEDYHGGGGNTDQLAAVTASKIFHNKFKGTGAAAGGIVTSSGMMPPCQHISLKECTDGGTNTMIVAEQSGWLLDQNPSSSKRYHGDPGWTVGGTGPGGGWISGTRRVDPVPEVSKPGGPPANWGADCWNITTVRYPLNSKRVLGAAPLPGCSENHGINNPLQSPHPRGVGIAMVDGSVKFLDQTIDLHVLLRMAIRNDGQPLEDEPN